MNELISLVAKSAPLLASALGSPIAGMALSLIESAVGMKGDALTQAIATDPSVAVQLKQLELQHQDILVQYANSDYQTEVDDKKNARSENDKHFWIVATLAIMFVSSYFLFVMFKSHLGLDAADAHQTQDNLTNALFLVLSYFYGSCHKSSS